MANVYVDSNAAGAGTGADWANAYVTLGAALAAKAAGDDFWVAHNHAETAGAAKTHTSPGTAAAPCRVICVNSAGSVPPVSADLATTGTVTTTGNFAMTFAGYAYCYGLTFSAGSGNSSAAHININTAAAGQWDFHSCKLVLGSTNNAPNIIAGSGTIVNVQTQWVNTTVQFGATGQSITTNGSRFIWRGTASAIAGATFPTNLFESAGFGFNVLVEGVDLSALTSGKTLAAAQNVAGKTHFRDCKLGSSVTIAATPAGPGAAETILTNCDSGDTVYRAEKYSYMGTETTETTIILTGGASNGTTGFAKKIVTTANAKPLLPFEALPIKFWNETTGSAITVTLQGIWGGGAVPNNNDIWVEAAYLGTSGFPLASFISDGLADPIATAAGQDAGSGTWGGSTTKFKLNVTFTPAEKGEIWLYVKAGAASSTFYIDSKPVVT